MKKTLQTIFFLLIVNFGYSQTTYIPMPPGYGIDFVSGTSELNNASLPLFQFGNYLYCKTRISTNLQEGKIFKVNMDNNQVIELTSNAPNPSYPEFYPLWWDYGMSQVRNVREINGEIYFNGWQTSVYKINTSNNTVSHLTNVQYNFEVLNNCLIPIGGDNGSSHITNLDNLSVYHFPSITIDNSEYNIRFENSLNAGNSLYAVGVLNGSGILGGRKKLFKIENSSYPNLNFTVLYDFNQEIGYLEGFAENKGFEPFLLNNRIIWKRQYVNTTTNQYEYCLASYDVSSNSFISNLYKPDNTGDFQYFVFNNNLYIKNSQGQFYITNGIYTPILTSIPEFYKYGSNFSFSIDYPYPGYSAGGPIVAYNGFLFGKNNGNTSADPRQIWKTDGTMAGTQLIYDGLDLFSAKVYNGNLYAYGYYTSEVNGWYHPKIFKFNNTSNAFEVIWSFPDSGYGTFSSHLFFNNENVFFSGGNGTTMQEGLYKLDLSTLSIKQNTLQSKTTFSPNPTASNITFAQEIKTLEIFDITGKKVKSFENTNTVFDVADLEKGIYLLKGKTVEDYNINEKLIKN